MADRRMISKNLFECDEMLSMNPGARLLYLGLLVNSDDNGVTRCGTRYAKNIECKIEDMKELAKSDFVIVFDDTDTKTDEIEENKSYRFVLRHWHTMNTLRRDRKKLPKGKIFDLITLDENSEYRLKGDNDCSYIEQVKRQLDEKDEKKQSQSEKKDLNAREEANISALNQHSDAEVLYNSGEPF